MPSSSPRQLRLGFVLYGAGPGHDAWRHPDAVADGGINVDHYIRQARLAEAGLFDFVFVPDSTSISARSIPRYLNRFEPLTILSALAVATRHIGLVGTITTSYSEPFTVARQLASLDQISRGRAGWNVVTSWLSGTAANHGKATHPAHDQRYRLAAEHLQVVRGLWDSYEDDAFVLDKASGAFLDPDKLHTLDHAGEFFSVRGPLNVARSAQGQPVIFQAGASDEGRDFAARHADGLYLATETLAETVEFARDVRSRAAAAGRDPAALQLFPRLSPIVAPTAEEARRKRQEVIDLIRIEEALKALGVAFDDHDFSAYPLDGPLPDVAAIGRGSNRFIADGIVRQAREGRLTLRQTALRVAAQRITSPLDEFIGTPEQVADDIERWFASGAIAGFNVAEVVPGQLEAFVDGVVPILQRRGLFRQAYGTTTLRGHLGLPVPANRYTRARAAVAAPPSPAAVAPRPQPETTTGIPS